jgi:hypothetical protein
MSSRAATVWNGPLTTYVQPAPDPAQAANRDQLTPNVSLTRGSTSGMFNGVSETFYTHDFSPAGTEWAVGSLANYASLTYTDWETCGGGRPVLDLPGEQLVVHLIADDIYLSLNFSYLGGHGGGGFSYERSTPGAVSNAPPRLAIQLTGNLLDISWPNAGGRLQSQTNGLGGSWATVPNSTTTNHMVIPMDRRNASVFYRLAIP